MTLVAAPLALVACFSMAASFSCHILANDGMEQHHHSKEWPGKAPDAPGACHATLCCGSNRKVRTIP